MSQNNGYNNQNPGYAQQNQPYNPALNTHNSNPQNTLSYSQQYAPPTQGTQQYYNPAQSQQVYDPNQYQQQPSYGAPPPTQEQLKQTSYASPTTQNYAYQPNQQYVQPPPQQPTLVAPPTQQQLLSGAGQPVYGQPQQYDYNQNNQPYNQQRLISNPPAVNAPPTDPSQLYKQQPQQQFQGPMVQGAPQQQPGLVSPQGYQDPNAYGRRAGRIDPSQMPSPAKRTYPKMYQKVEYTTDSQDGPPSSTVRISVADRGSAHPAILRASLKAIPQTKELLNDSGLFMGAILNPLAELEPTDLPNSVPIVDTANNELVRCNRCRSYVNPFTRFDNMGRDFSCNFCGFNNQVPRWYLSNLDGYGKRRDLEMHPELSYGTVDYVATNDLVTKPPTPLTYVFVLDVSSNSLRQEIFQTVCNTLRNIIDELVANESDLSQCKVTFVTFARSIHFYNLHETHPQMMVVGDLSQEGSGFVPFPQDSLVTFDQVASSGFIEKLITLGSQCQESDQVMGSALVAAQSLLSEHGGRIVIFSSQLPALGQGRIKPREDFKQLGSDKEKSLYAPQLGFWKSFGDQCASSKVSVDMYLFGSGFMETSTLTQITQLTNGHTYLYHHFDPKRDSERLHGDLRRHLSRPTAYDCMIKMRCSSGISIRRYFGHYVSPNEDEMDLAGIDSDTAFGIEFKHDSKLDENQSDHFIQAVMLYTTRTGHRRLRVMTSKLNLATTMSSLFKKADMDATLALTSRLLSAQVVKNRESLENVQQMINNYSIGVLTAYRKYCSQASAPGQLVLPEALKLLPVYYLGLQKSPCFRTATDVMLDERINNFNLLMEMPIRSVLMYCYPYLFSLHNMPPSEIVDGYDRDGNVIQYALPPQLSLTASKIESDGLYLLCDGLNMYWFVGRQCDAGVLSAVFGVESVDQVDGNALVQPNVDTELGARVKAIVDELNRMSARRGMVRVIKERDQMETLFYARLIEDRVGHNGTNYVEHLIWMHKEIQGKLDVGN
ncbi:COPII adaptor coat protein sec23/sec24 [Acrasis kona]|uniref:COPII adaptor coat protein sec23/sec24 n=1 Tax=Acrasis kona TaxID=1008807 RepID=A0AAW2YKF4_9EUKA